MERDRRKRIDLYKKIIVTVVLLSILIPLTLCIFLFGKVCQLKHEINDLEAFKNQYYIEMQQYAAANNEASSPEETSTPSESSSENSSTTESQSTQGEDVDGQQSLAPYGSDKTQTSIIETQPQETTSDGGMNQDKNTEEPFVEPTTEETTTEDTRKKVYLTFDDGPSANTEAILDILKEYNAKATFFVNAKDAEVYADTYRRIVAEGHTLAMHSYSHVYKKVYASVDAFMADMHKLRDYLYDITGVTCDIYRFPGGSSNKVSDIDMREFGKALAEEGIVYFDWNVESRDATSPPRPADEIYNNVTLGIPRKNVPVVLMHDMKSKITTVEALPRILQYLVDNNYNIAALDSSVELVQHVRID